MAGILLTSDGGKSWGPSSAGFVGRRHIACITLNSDPDSQIWYAGEGLETGPNTATGGFYKSTDGGKTWDQTTDQVAFCGNGNVAQESGTGGPRSVGRLIVSVDGKLYIGTFSNGVFADTTGVGDAFTLLSITLLNALVRCLVSDPTTPSSKFWVGLHDQSFFVENATYAAGVATITTTMPHNYSNGQAIRVTGVSPGGYNGTYTITVPLGSADTFTYSPGSDPGTYVSGGAVVENSVKDLFGLWTVTSGGVATHITAPGLPSSVRTVEEILWITTSVGYAACHSQGIYKTTDGGANWSQTAALNSASQWCAIDGYRDGSDDILIVGCTNPQVDGGVYGGLYKSVNSGTSWSVISGISPLIFGKGFNWWMNINHPANLLGGSDYAAHQVVHDPVTTGRWMVSGKAGVWITTDSGANWSPAVYHLTPTGHRFAAIDPNDDAKVALWSDDWNYFGSVDNLATIQQSSPASITTMAGMTIADDSTVYVSGAAGGSPMVASAPNPLSTFTSLSFPSTSIPRGVITGRDSDGNQILLVATTEDGIWELRSGTWGHVCDPSIGCVAFADPPPSGFPPAYFAWPPGQFVVLAFDPNVGIVKNIHAGAHVSAGWFLYWDKPATGEGAQIACDTAGNMYVAVGSLFYVVTGVLSMDENPVNEATQVNLKDGFHCDAVGITPGGIPIICTTPTDGVPGTILRSLDQGTNWDDFTDDSYRAFSGNVDAVRATNDGWIYAATNGSGAYAGRYRLPGL